MNASAISRVIAVLGKFLTPEEMTSIENLIGELLSSKASQFDWSYPLSEVLDHYNQRILEQQCNLNYSETALIIQNSANVFERRVDRLYQDTSGLRNSLNEHDAENEAAKASKSRQRGRRNQLDLDNIERIDFLTSVSKNCLLKTKKRQKNVKLLSERHPQLENMCGHEFSFDIFDTNGEKIGKKNAFRCNENLSAYNMLVDELSPDDLQIRCADERTENGETSLNLSLSLRNSDIADNLSTSSSISPELQTPNGHSSPTLSQSLQEPQYTSDLEADDFCDNEPGNESQESGYGTMTDISGNLTQDLSQSINSSSSLLDVSGQLTPPEEIQQQMENNLTSDLTTAPNLSQLTIDEEAEKSCDDGLNSPMRKRSRESVETDAGYTSGDPQDIPSSPESIRQSKRLRRSVINELNSDGFQAIPFEAPIPEKSTQTRTEFKLPCHISLLRSTARKKRKASGETRRQRKLSRYLEREKIKVVAKSAEEELEERLLKERLSCSISDDFQAILTENEDLRGFSLRFSEELVITKEVCEVATCLEEETPEKEREIEKEIEKEQESTTITSDIMDNCLQELQETSCSYTPPHSPDFSGGFEPGGLVEEEGDCEPSTSEMSHQEKIEKKMRELQLEFDIRNDRVDESLKWARAMEVLRAAQRRPEFDVKNYERRIVRHLGAEPERCMEFEEMTKREEPEDIARLFVASLHLGNTYDVGISTNEETSSVILSLLKDDKYTE